MQIRQIKVRIPYNLRFFHLYGAYSALMMLIYSS